MIGHLRHLGCLCFADKILPSRCTVIAGFEFGQVEFGQVAFPC